MDYGILAALTSFVVLVISWAVMPDGREQHRVVAATGAA
jgi:hypothetical protein